MIQKLFEILKIVFDWSLFLVNLLERKTTFLYLNQVVKTIK